MGNKINKLIIRVNNYIRGKKKCSTAPDKVLIIFSHCLQNSKCQQKIVADLSNCKRCGKCKVKDILEIAEKYKVQVAVGSGSEMALEKVHNSKADTVIAIACEKELAGGIKALLPKKVLALTNTRPHGPCKDCGVDIANLDQFVRNTIR